MVRPGEMDNRKGAIGYRHEHVVASPAAATDVDWQAVERMTGGELCLQLPQQLGQAGLVR